MRKLVWAFSMVMLGCGGTIVTGGGGDSGSDAADDHVVPSDSKADAPPFDAADSGKPWSPVCPEVQPAVGSACTMPDPRDTPELLCEYGAPEYDPSCNTILTCQGGRWTVSQAGPKCQPDGPNPSECPASEADVMHEEGGSCSAAGLRCEYPEGVCVCSTGFGGPIEIDGGTHWACDPGPGCPMPRPRLGSSCSGPSTACEYFPCDFAEACMNGFWQGLFEGCASPGGG